MAIDFGGLLKDYGPSLGLTGLGLGLGFMGSNKSNNAAGDATATLTNFWNEAQQQYQEQFGQALEALAAGEAEASDEILRGLGMSIEERTKFFDIANENLDWVVDFGKQARGDVKAGMEQAGQFLDHYSELIFNPDAIYDTDVYKGIKNRTMEEWENFYSGKGLLGGNAQEAMVERLAETGYNFLQGERSAALSGQQAALDSANTALNQVGLGAQAAGQQSQMAMNTGNANAADIMNAHTNLAGITQAFHPAGFMMDNANFMGEGTANLGNAIANAELAGDMGQSNMLGGLGNALITAGMGNMFGGGGNMFGGGGSGAGNFLQNAFFSGNSFSPFTWNAQDERTRRSSTFGG